MLFNRSQIRLQTIAAIPSILLGIVCLGYYAVSAMQSDRWPGGGSAAGLVCGIAAGGIIAFEMLLWPRKALRRFKLIRTKYWLAAHIWLGLVSLPLAIAHCGFHWGGWLPTVFLVTFLATILSGIYGVIVQNILPRWLLRNVPAETIHSQIDFVSLGAAEDARRLLVSVCGPRRDAISSANHSDAGNEHSGAGSNSAERDHADDSMTAVGSSDAAGPIVIGALRTSGRTRGRTLRTHKFAPSPQDAQTLWSAYDQIRPFLIDGAATATTVSDPPAAERWFDQLSRACHPSSVETIDVLRRMCDARRQYDVQRSVHRWLHAWLPIHIAVSIATTVLLIAHVYTALRYW